MGKTPPQLVSHQGPREMDMTEHFKQPKKESQANKLRFQVRREGKYSEDSGETETPSDARTTMGKELVQMASEVLCIRCLIQAAGLQAKIVQKKKKKKKICANVRSIKLFLSAAN